MPFVTMYDPEVGYRPPAAVKEFFLHHGLQHVRFKNAQARRIIFSNAGVPRSAESLRESLLDVLCTGVSEADAKKWDGILFSADTHSFITDTPDQVESCLVCGQGIDAHDNENKILEGEMGR